MPGAGVATTFASPGVSALVRTRIQARPPLRLTFVPRPPRPRLVIAGLAEACHARGGLCLFGPETRGNKTHSPQETERARVCRVAVSRGGARRDKRPSDVTRRRRSLESVSGFSTSGSRGEGHARLLYWRAPARPARNSEVRRRFCPVFATDTRNTREADDVGGNQRRSAGQRSEEQRPNTLVLTTARSTRSGRAAPPRVVPHGHVTRPAIVGERPTSPPHRRARTHRSSARPPRQVVVVGRGATVDPGVGGPVDPIHGEPLPRRRACVLASA